MKKFAVIISMLFLLFLFSNPTTLFKPKEKVQVAYTSDDIGDFKLKLTHKQYDEYYSLNGYERDFYDFVAEQSLNILNGEEYFQNYEIQTLPEDIDFSKVKKALVNDYRYLVWWQFSWNITTGKTTKIEINTPYGSENVLGDNYIEKAQISLKTAYFISQTDTNKKLEYFRDIIVNLADYDYEWASMLHKSSSYADTVRNGNARSFISVFDQDITTKSLCSGYADAFQLLCDLSGIECYTVNGYVDDDETLHQWNIVYKDGKKYIIDLTTCTGLWFEQIFMEEVEGTEYIIKNKFQETTYKEITEN